MNQRKYAVLSMDIEDWYHLDYFSKHNADKSKTMLDGLINYIDLLEKYELKTTFFTLSELSDSAGEAIGYAASKGHEIACHGKDHVRPVLKDVTDFALEIAQAKEKLSKLCGKEVTGYRAPCYSIDRQRLNEVIKAGFSYDSSKIAFNGHPLYGRLDIDDFRQVRQGVYEKDGFFEFELSTKKLLGKNLPVSGGGYIRLLPWLFMKPLIKSYLKDSETYVLYIHPFELSKADMPSVEKVPFLTDIRARKGLKKVETKIEQLIEMLLVNDFEIMTFGSIMEKLKTPKKETVR